MLRAEAMGDITRPLIQESRLLRNTEKLVSKIGKW